MRTGREGGAGLSTGDAQTDELGEGALESTGDLTSIGVDGLPSGVRGELQP